MFSLRQATRRFITSAVLCLICGLLWAGSASETHNNHADEDHETTIPHIDKLVYADERLNLVATTNILGDVVSNIIGSEADLIVIMPVGQNPHSYTPTPTNLKALETADIVLTNGFGLEEGLLANIDHVTKGMVVSVSAGIDLYEGDDHAEDDHAGHAHADGNPHVWTDPGNVLIWISNLVEVLSAADPSRGDIYRQNADTYRTAVEQLDREIRENIAPIPPERRKLVTDHEVFTYFAEAYGFETVGAIVPGASDQAEPSPKEVAMLVNTIQREQVHTIFVGRTSSRGLSSLARSIGSEVGWDVRILPTLTGSLAPKGEAGDSYLSYMRFNVNQIVSGLQD